MNSRAAHKKSEWLPKASVLDFDAGPPPEWAELFAGVPDYFTHKEFFWYDWGPAFYRGRLDGSSRVLCIASDPGPTERIANRTLVGDAGQRLQGFLAKVGITRSYLCVNAFAFGLIPAKAQAADVVLNHPDHVSWRNRVFDKGKGTNTQVVIAFGAEAQKAVALWNGVGTTPLVKVPHPSDRDTKTLLAKWRDAVVQLRKLITPDLAGTPLPDNYGQAMQESDYARIPHRDLPFGLPDWFGDDHWLRTSKSPQPNCVSRPHPDDRHTLIWIAPRS